MPDTDTDTDTETEGLDQVEEQVVEEQRALRAPVIYELVQRRGLEELERPVASLWWSGIAAGLALSVSFYAQAFLHGLLPVEPWSVAVTSVGYTVGFLIVVLGRLQLFTEDTIVVVLPLLAAPSFRRLGRAARLWLVVLAANLVGTALSAGFVSLAGVDPADLATFIDLAEQQTGRSFTRTVVYGVPAGFLVAAMAWVLPSADGSKGLVIVAFTYVIALGGFAHVIVGSTDGFVLVFNGEMGLAHMLLRETLPALIGNVVGGTGLFALVSYGQVRKEL